ncbi:MAG: GDSL-type esterase/lipase family protein [Nannocystaceae bacterium]|nr:GDSL-type esterase/lipase family protein [bacterium]
MSRGLGSPRVRILALASLALSIVLGVVWAFRNLPIRFERTIRGFEAYDRAHGWPEDAVLFVGSSSIRKWPIDASFPNYATIHRGFGGCFLSDVDHFADRIVFPYAPRVIVLYAGENDMDDRRSAEQVFETYRRFAERTQARLPRTQLLYLPIKPTPERWALWPEMKRANARIAAYIEHHPQQHYVDTATPMLGEDGRPRPELYADDGVHLSPAGYALWTRIVEPYLEP